MSNVVKLKEAIPNDLEVEKISYSKAAELLGMDYQTARNTVLNKKNKIIIFDYGPRNKKVSKPSLLNFIERGTYDIV